MPFSGIPSVLPSAYERLLRELSDELSAIEAEGLLRRLTSLEAVDGPVVRIDGRALVCWGSNDYLGLSTHPALTEAAADAARSSAFLGFRRMVKLHGV